MFQHGSILQTLGRSVFSLGEHATVKSLSKQTKEKDYEDYDEDSSSSSSSDDRPSLRPSSSSPIFSTLFSIISSGSCSGYKRQMSIHEEYRSYFATPTFANNDIITDLDQAKNKDIEQPSKPMLHPVLLEPHVLQKEEFDKLVKKDDNDLKLISDEDKNKNENYFIECPICLCNIKIGSLIVQAKCGHVFHHKCIRPWFVEHHSCPICRAEIESA
ncbi:hypothetical protein M9Y10_002284 [Tritrichomonas musculus]|uniref:RING-type domain-containing protein n=1 Tax=Tritrichomonas musculus TaxID=1915356 RepID=A0ABR2LAF4_9EUKA